MSPKDCFTLYYLFDKWILNWGLHTRVPSNFLIIHPLHRVLQITIFNQVRVPWNFFKILEGALKKKLKNSVIYTFQVRWRSTRGTGPDRHREPGIAAPNSGDVVLLHHFLPLATHLKVTPSSNDEPGKRAFLFRHFVW